MKPEVLAPAGDLECLRAAVENGADAVYFGVRRHNARARASNFAVEELADVFSYLHARGVKGYVAFNTLLFTHELAEAQATLETMARAGADAVILQDLGVARLVREISSDLPMHASTQTTTTCAEEIEAIRDLGFERVILARELSIREIRRIGEKTTVPLEVFVHGALCVAYSGQCLTSEALGGRSANRGACAQACRQPYDLIVDGRKKEMGERRYLLSPQDLAAVDLVPELVAAGVAALKIEGRLKTPEYVAATTAAYRRAVDGHAELSREEERTLRQVFSRGFSHGFLSGTDHQALVDGVSPKKRGLFLGRVERMDDRRVRLRLENPVKPGDGVCFDFGDPEADEAGGRVYEVKPLGRQVELAFGADLDWSKVHVGDRVWKTDDPAINRRLRATFEGLQRRVSVDALMEGRAGEPLRLTLCDGHRRVTIESEGRLEIARARPLTVAYLREHLGRLGATPFELRELDVRLEGEVILPVSQINQMRRRASEELESARRAAPVRVVREGALARLRTESREPVAPMAELVVLCRSMEQMRIALAEGCRTIELDFEDVRPYRDAVAEVRERGAWVALAPPRVHKLGEEGVLRFIASCLPNAVLARNLMHVRFFRDLGRIGDFSLNVANDLTVRWAMDQGLTRYVPAYDLSIEQMEDLLRATAPAWAEVVVHQHMPMFHMEHCVFAAFLTRGHDCTNCGRPCDVRQVRLRDWTGHEHPVKADVGCRNTVYNAVPQSASPYIRRLSALGVRWFRVELLLHGPDETRRLIRGYREVLEGRGDGRVLWEDLNASDYVGVTRGPLAE